MCLKHIICLLCLIMPVSAQAAGRDKFLEIQTVHTQSGLSAWLVEDHSVPIIAIEFAFEGAGAAHDPADKQGLSQLASNTMDEGADDLDSEAFQGTLLKDSISLSFSSGRDHYAGSLKTRTVTKDTAFSLLQKSLTAPRFDQDPLARMKESNLARIKSSLSDPEWINARLFNDKVFAGHPYALNSGGTLTTLPKLGRGDLKNFVKTRLARNNLKIAMTGDITKDEAARVIEQIFAALPEKAELGAVADLTPQHPGQRFLYETDIPQTIIQAAMPAMPRAHPDYYPFQVMNQILGASGFGSRLTEELREKRGLTYGIYTSLQNMEHTNFLQLYLSTANENAGEALKLLKSEMVRMADTDVSEAELKDAVSYINGSLPLTLSSTSSIAGLLLGVQLDHLGIDYLDQRADAFNAVRIEDVRRVAKTYLKPDLMTVIMTGQPQGLDHDTTKLTELPNVE